MLESYVRNAPKRHELYQGNLEFRGYACREYGGKCADWLVKDALEPNGHAVVSGNSVRGPPSDKQKKTISWQTAVCTLE